MADKQLSIALVGTDEASGVVGQSMKKMGADLEAMQKQTFNATHDAHARELRELSDHFGQITAQYKAQHARLLAYEEQAQAKLGELRRARSGLRATPEIMAQHREIGQVRSLIARNEDVQAAAEEAGIAEQTKYEESLMGRTGLMKPGTPWWKTDVGFLRSPHMIRAMMGGFIASAGLRTALGITRAAYAGQEYQALAGNINARTQDVAQARLSLMEARGGAMSGVPIFGDMVRQISDLAGNKPLIEKLGRSAGEAAEKLSRLGTIVGGAADKLGEMQAKLYGFGAVESAAMAAEHARIERMGEMHQALETQYSAGQALGAARTSGVRRTAGLHFGWNPWTDWKLAVAGATDWISPNQAVGLPQAERASEQTSAKIAALRGLQVSEAEQETRNLEQQHIIDNLQFDRAMKSREFKAQRMGLYQTPAMAREAETFEMSQKQDALIEEDLRLTARQNDMRDKEKWRAKWMEEEYEKRTSANPDLAKNSDALRKTIYGESDAEYVKRLEALHEAESRQSENRRVTGLEAAGLEARQKRDVGSETEQAQMIGMGGSVLQSKQREKERLQIEYEGRTEAKAISDARLTAMQDKFDAEDWERGRKHDVAMRDALAGQTFDREAIRKREMDRIAEGYEDDLLKFQDNEDEKKRILDEIAEKQKALATRQAEERRGERMGLLQQAGGLIGGPMRNVMEQAELAEKYRKLKQQYGYGTLDALQHTTELGAISRMEAVEKANLDLQQKFFPHEVQGRTSWDTMAPKGYDSPMVGLTRQLQQLNAFLAAHFGGGIQQVSSFLGG